MTGKAGKELANLTTLQVRMLLVAARGAELDGLDAVEQYALSIATAKLEAALGKRGSMIMSKPAADGPLNCEPRELTLGDIRRHLGLIDSDD